MHMMQVFRATASTRQVQFDFNQLKRQQQFYCVPQRGFSDKKDEYSDKFESLLGKAAKPITDAEKAEIERQKAEKAVRDAASAEQEEIDRDNMAEQKARDFDDLLSGKKKAASEKNL